MRALLYESVSFCHFDIIYWTPLKKNRQICLVFYAINHLVKVGVTVFFVFFYSVGYLILSSALQKQMLFASVI